MKFIYNNKIYNPVNLEKKLKKLGITINDITPIEETKNSEELNEEIRKYYFRNLRTGEVIVSIYPNLNDLKNRIIIEDWKIYDKGEN
jgi:hypothetical protein